ncbi:4-hydroxy-tetrahydrodipicolinate synthase [Thermostichus vulcanus]|uniref:4-hydroxy-tetrahydrodipicolinate synthase n=1 Tax=Thermostichus vulcanus str. 'Rupite' TaxID=2813851 RepID=A0ABT0C6R9_THEVL|nr:4-hydroxy-tetrahydrodipicolinate synthase [Thermostichus vulcanus str. 'Rupite']
MNWGRVLTAMITPFTAEGELNYDEAARLADYLVTHGSDGLVVCGTTGESPTLTWQEEFELFRVVRDAVAGRAKVIAGTGSNSTREAIEATKKAAQLGLDGSLQVVPYYNKPTQAGLYQHFKAIAEASDLPILLYNIPGRTGASLQPETVANLAELETIVAIKEASGMMDVASEIRRLTPSRFGIYSGDDSLTLPILSLGGSGVVSVASHLVGLQLQELIQSYSRGQHDQALAHHLRLFPLFKVLFIETNPVPVKAALEMQGWKVGRVRLPLAPLQASSLQALRQVLEEMGLLTELKGSERIAANIS